VRKQHQRALQLLQENEGKLHEIAHYLYVKETITGEEFMEILNAPPGLNEPAAEAESL